MNKFVGSQSALFNLLLVSLLLQYVYYLDNRVRDQNINGTIVELEKLQILCIYH
jgi:hypothetical protein